MTLSVAEIIERRPFIKLAAGAFATAAGCRRNTDPAYARGDTLIAGVTIYEKGALNPDELPSTLVFLPLVRIDAQGERQSCLAASWQHSADFLEWTYRLRPGVRWHDGRPVTAYDVKATLDAWSDDFAKDLTCTVRDTSTVTIRGAKWATGIDEFLGILPKHLVEHLDPDRIYQWDFWMRPVGCGPYRLLRRQATTMVELEANPDYYKGPPRIQRIMLKFTKGADLTELLSGNVDTIHLSDTAQLPVIAHDSRFRTYWAQSAGIGGILSLVWNNEHPLFREPDVRRALSLAINRRELAQLLNLPGQSALVDGLYTRRQLQRGEATEPPFDLVEARRLLEAAGWRVPGGGGLRERNGQPFHFTALLQPGMSVAAVYLQAQLRSLGIGMEIQPVDLSDFRSKLRARHFEASVGRSASVWSVLSVFRSQSIGYRNPQMEKLLDVAEATADPVAMDQAYRDISAALRTDQPVAFLTRLTSAYVVHRRVKGLSAPWHSDPLWNIDGLSLDSRRDG
jgi:peptide/nickel transport system substrate-binding protein